MGADRLVRCNPFAFEYQLRDQPKPFHIDGRLLDPVPIVDEFFPRIELLPLAIIPGLSRVRAGRPGDGLISIFMITSLGASAHKLYSEGKQIRGGILGLFSLLFWFSDIYSATIEPSRSVQNRGHESVVPPARRR